MASNWIIADALSGQHDIERRCLKDVPLRHSLQCVLAPFDPAGTNCFSQLFEMERSHRRESDSRDKANLKLLLGV